MEWLGSRAVTSSSLGHTAVAAAVHISRAGHIVGVHSAITSIRLQPLILLVHVCSTGLPGPVPMALMREQHQPGGGSVALER